MKMGILKRFADIVSARANKALDNCEDPVAMLEMQLREMENDLANIKCDTAAIMAQEKMLGRKKQFCEKQIEQLTELAKQALIKGKENEARLFLTEKLNKENELSEIDMSLETTKAHSLQMLQLHKTFSRNVSQMENKKSLLENKVRLTEAQKKINATTDKLSAMENNMTNYNMVAEKIELEFDKALAYEQINSSLSSYCNGSTAIELTEGELEKLRKVI